MKVLRVICCLFLLLLSLVVFAPDGTITFEGGPHQELHGQVGKLCAALS